MTAVIDDVEIGLDLSQLVDIDKELCCVPCAETDEKSTAATWLSIHDCCGLQFPYCNDHRKVKIDFIKRYGKDTKCTICHKEAQLRWVKL